MLETISPQEFEQQVRDCLAHFYDFGFLRDQLLVNLLAPNHTGATQVQVFRQIVTEIIEGLRPDVGAAFHSKQARIYNILMLRYIDQQQPQDVMQQLALSERQFYRDHPRAIQTLGQLLWERITGTPAPGDGNAPPGELQAAEVSIESEVRRVHNQSEQTRIDLRALLQGAITATQSLANQHHVHVALDLTHEMSVFGIDSGMMRQTVLMLMSQLIVRFTDGGRLGVNVALARESCRISFVLEGSLSEPDGPSLHRALAGHQSLETLIGTLEGELQVEQATRQYTINLKVPVNQQTVLLVDDNPGIIDLFQRWLAGQPYHILTARDGEQAVRAARQWLPSVIILDVMLPGTDGWEVLQNLKTHPSTREIPVLVCSVLDACDLAMSLGADACLKKPPNQTEFLEILEHWQA